MIFDDNLYAAPAYTFTEQEAGCKSSEKGCTGLTVQPERMGKENMNQDQFQEHDVVAPVIAKRKDQEGG